MDDLTPFYAALQRARLASGAKGGYDPASGLTTKDGLVSGARSRLRAIITETVENEAKGRTWGSRGERRRWVRSEAARRYRDAVAPEHGRR